MKKLIGLISIISIAIFFGSAFAQEDNCPNIDQDVPPVITVQENEFLKKMPNTTDQYIYTKTPLDFKVNFLFPSVVKKQADYFTARPQFGRPDFDAAEGEQNVNIDFKASSGTTDTLELVLPIKTVSYDENNSYCRNSVPSNTVTIKYQSDESQYVDCDAVAYSDNSTNGSEYNTSLARYVNKSTTASAVDLCFASDGCRDYIGCADLDQTACKELFDKKYNRISSMYTMDPYSNNMTSESVWEVQFALQQVHCGTAKDCKFGQGTIKSVFGCTCETVNPARKTPTGTTCASGSKFVDASNMCCIDENAPTPDNTEEADACTGENISLKNGKCVCNPKYQKPNGKYQCCGIELLTDVPFIGKCIIMMSQEDINALRNEGKFPTDNKTLIVTGEQAFPRLMLGLTKILVTVILLVSFIAIIVAGVMIAASGDNETNATNGKKLIGSVIIALALLGASGVILRLINPNFFG